MDKWCGDELLCAFFPSLFALTDSIVACLVDLWVQLGPREYWNLCFTQPLSDWELDELGDLFLWLHGMTID